MRVEYDQFHEPEHITQFRRGFGGGWNLANFSWVPQDGQPQQEILVARCWDTETSAFGLEFILWNRLTNTYEHVFFDGRALPLFLGLVGDLLSKNTKWPSTERSDNQVLEARLAVGEDGEPLWYSDRGRWYRDETAYRKWAREAKARARGIKGPLADKGGDKK